MDAKSTPNEMVKVEQCDIDAANAYHEAATKALLSPAGDPMVLLRAAFAEHRLTSADEAIEAAAKVAEEAFADSRWENSYKAASTVIARAIRNLRSKP